MQINKQKESNLTQEYLKEILHYDPFAGTFVWRVAKAQRLKIGDYAGTIHKNVCGKRYRRIHIDGEIYSAHRLAFLYMTGEFPKNQVDHDDGDGLNNKWGNLNEATDQENSKNKRLHSNNTSNHVGVYLRKDTGKWSARININGRRKHLGSFKEKPDAIAARKAAAIDCCYHPGHGSPRPL